LKLNGFNNFFKKAKKERNVATDILKAFEPLFYPKSLAVIGASSDMTKFGNIILSALLEIGFEGKIYPINTEGGEINGLKAYRSLREIPGEVDFAVMTIPAPAVKTLWRNACA